MHIPRSNVHRRMRVQLLYSENIGYMVPAAAVCLILLKRTIRLAIVKPLSRLVTSPIYVEFKSMPEGARSTF